MILLFFVNIENSQNQNLVTIPNSVLTDKRSNYVVVTRPVTIANYFQYIDSIVQRHNASMPYHITEHLLVRTNPWIIDTLQHTDYYIKIHKGQFVYNQRNINVLQEGEVIKIPDEVKVAQLKKVFENTRLDLNIPEYKLRIIENDSTILNALVRVGKNERKYLKMVKKVVDLKTKTGSGIIVNHVKNPDYYNPVNGKRYFQTKRDDNKITLLPQIPFLETEINGIRNGQLIHPTTNPVTLGKSYSNGCIGTSEADAWYIYYHSPIGTKITIRYDLNITNDKGFQVMLEDIYQLKH